MDYDALEIVDDCFFLFFFSLELRNMNIVKSVL